MTPATFRWMSQDVPFRPGETVAAALSAAGVVSLGRDQAGAPSRYFCGVGACQCCLVNIDGRPLEACLTLARPGLSVTPLELDHA